MLLFEYSYGQIKNGHCYYGNTCFTILCVEENICQMNKLYCLIPYENLVYKGHIFNLKKTV